MILEPYQYMKGWWVISGQVNNISYQFIVSEKMYALDRMFRKLRWDKVGNWGVGFDR